MMPADLKRRIELAQVWADLIMEGQKPVADGSLVCALLLGIGLGHQR